MSNSMEAHGIYDVWILVAKTETQTCPYFFISGVVKCKHIQEFIKTYYECITRICDC